MSGSGSAGDFRLTRPRLVGQGTAVDVLIAVTPPDVEEDALCGLRSVCGDVAVWPDPLPTVPLPPDPIPGAPPRPQPHSRGQVWGVAAADDSASATHAGRHGGWWQLCGDGARRDAIVVAALVLRADTRCARVPPAMIEPEP